MAAPENPFAVSVQNPELTYSRGMYNKPQDYVNKARLAAFGAKGELSPDLEDLTAESFEYSPEAQAYLNKVDEYLSKTQGGPYEVSPYGFSVTDRQTGAARPLTNEELMALAAKPDFENQFAASFGDPTGEEAWDIGRFAVRPDQEVRLINRDTGEVVASGMGYEGGSLAAKAAAGIFGQEGKKANFILQGASPGGDWETITEHKPERSGFGQFVATALPLAMMPLTMGATAPLAKMGTLAKIGLGAGVGGATSAARGQDILKGAITGGLTAAGTQFLPGPLKSLGIDDKVLRQSIGAGLGATTGGVITGQPLDKSLMGGAIAAGTTYIGGKLFNPATTPVNQTTTSGDVSGNIGSSGVELDDIVVTGGIPRFSGAVFTPSFADKAQLSSEATDRAIAEGGIGGSGVELNGLDPDAITVTGRRLPNFSGSAFTPSFFDTASDFAVKSDTDQQIAEEETPTEDEILVKGTRGPTTGSSNFAVSPTTTDSGLTKDEIEVIAKKKTDTGSSTAAVGGPDVDPEFGEDIEVTAKKTDATKTGTPLVPTNLLDQIADPKVKEDLEKGKEDDAKKKLDVADYMRLLGLAVGLGGNLFGGGGGGKSPGKYSSTGRLSSTFTDKLPTPGQNGAFTVGGLGGTAADQTFAARPVTDWYRYGMGPAMDIPAGADLSRATSPYAGYGPGTLGEETFKAVSGIPEQPVGMAHGGDMGYSRGSSRESFAVNGPGTGRSDDIPAVLSDGEYVIDAETVALLGDGSSKAGAKKLDEMRVKIRKAKGKNLAKGKFSVNAKRPEAYMSGGRI